METEQIKDELVAMLMRGERPEGMSYSDFKIKRKAIQQYIKQRNKGTLKYNPEKEIPTKIGDNNEVLETRIVNVPYKKN